jgi:hypothetical protein
VLFLGLALGAAAAWLQNFTLEEHRDFVLLHAPSDGGTGAGVTRAQIAAFQAEEQACEESGARCAVVVGTFRYEAKQVGWLTPIAVR